MRLRIFQASLDDDFRRMGLGIEQRHNRCTDWWAPHLRCSRDFIKRHLPRAGRIAVLGAGRLLDIDATDLVSKGDELHLFDADSGCTSKWRERFGDALGSSVYARTADVTGCLTAWSSTLRAAMRDVGLLEYLRSLRAPIPPWADEPFDVIVSLNILGQIPLYWRDFVRERASRMTEGEEEALVCSMAQLQEAHIAALERSRAGCVIALFDSEYYFYEASRSEWHVEDSLFGESRSQIFSHHLSRALTAQESWLWHLAPQFIEHDEEGEIHRVEARVWKRGDVGVL